ncbi:efflux RND transporter periplasmic adaptor subunit [Methylobacterium gnaphalii]|uniref:efflux RND transporter periplasmic adaptor subunit n=1 Tax=Methylobacterium gnaphalii TaxID=1010610 RepID=UPI001478DC68|nr:secretion protein HylD [Methylobacterium gnaphalii]
MPAGAESTPEGTSVVGVRAGAACLKEQVRISGFALAREESGASVPLEGYRISEILVSEGDTVTVGQELARATRLGGDTGRPGLAQALPPTYSLRAPIAGRITKLNLRVGMVTSLASAIPSASGQPPEPQVRIMADTGIDLLVDVPSLFITKIRTGLTARILIEDGREAAGTVRVPASEVDPATQLGRARLSVEPAAALRPGQFASAVLDTARDCGLSVPRTAVSYRNGEATVQVLNGTAVETRSVRTGLFDENAIRISDGLSEGEPIVANSGNDLRPGDKVRSVIIDGASGASR